MRINLVLLLFLIKSLCFAQDEYFEVEFNVSGKMKPLESYTITINDNHENKIQASVQLVNSPYRILLKQGLNYNVTISSKCFINHRLMIDKNVTTNSHLVKVELYKALHCTESIKREYQFGKNKYKITDHNKYYLKELATLLDSSKSIDLEINAHRDFLESKNVDKKRAEAFSKKLISFGVNPSRIHIACKGINDPLLSMDDIDMLNSPEEKEAAHQFNRRINLSFYSEEQ